MSKINFECIHDLPTAKQLWLEFSPDKIIYDNWDFRYCFYQDNQFDLYFYVGQIDGKNIGLLPLQFNTRRHCLEFFGSAYMEDNQVFIKPEYEKYIPEFYQLINQQTQLEDIIGRDSFTQSLELLEYKYVADLSDVKNLDDYLKKYFRNKRRKNLLKIIEIVENKQPQIFYDQKEDLSRLMELNRTNFGEESSFSDPLFTKVFDYLMSINLNFHLITIVINNIKESVSLAVKYKDTYTYMNAGTNKKDHPNLGSYINLKNIELAINLGCKTFDAGVEDLGWKEKWHLDKISQYKFYKD
jgi:hypothetical protein